MTPRRAVVSAVTAAQRSGRQLISFSLERGPRQSHTPAGEHTRKERRMLGATLGMLAMLPVLFGVAGYVMVSR